MTDLTLHAGERLLVATTNAGKLQEMRTLLAGLPLTVVALDSVPPVEAPEETGETFEENARLKARFYAQATGLLAVADDSGFEVDALDGAPGVWSARYPGATYAERFVRLNAEVARRGSTDRRARFVCAIALARGDEILFEARGVVEGELAFEPRGTNGFGYDPIFLHPPSGRTFGELTEAEKGDISHRGQALRLLRAFVVPRLEPTP